MSACNESARRPDAGGEKGPLEAAWDSEGFYRKVNELHEKGEPFATAIVVKIEGHSLGKPGFKAIVTPDKSILGYVGGSCVDVAVVETALEALTDGNPKTISLKLEEEEEGGIGPPCGGTIHIYIEPHLPRERLVVFSAPGEWSISTPLARLGRALGFKVTVFEPLAQAEKYPEADEVVSDDPTLSLERIKINRWTYVVLAARHGYDMDILRQIVDSEAAYIGVIGSQKRIRWIFERLRESGVSEALLRKIVAPAGLDIGAKTPEEIALSIMADIVRRKRGGSGRPLTEVKGIEAETVSPAKP